MRLFACRVCGAMLYFENTQCESCAHRLGFDPARLALTALDPAGDGVWRDPAGTYRFCANAAHDVCNWLIPASDPHPFCRACRHNRTIPNLSVPEHRTRWATLEAAKHRLIYALLRLGLPLATRAENPSGLAFDFLADPPAGLAVMTGHDEGLVTIALREADEADRTRTRLQMGEPYRTPLGHFRHETGHHYWNVLIRDADDPARRARFRALFGDERQDYARALEAHYARADDGAWRAAHVSFYAASHPWEDFAETWAHYLHIIATLDTAASFGLKIEPRGAPAALRATIDFDPYAGRDIAALIGAWLPLCFAVNSLNRAMGQPDLYPFVLPPPVIEKLGFVQGLMPLRG